MPKGKKLTLCTLNTIKSRRIKRSSIRQSSDAYV